MKDIKLVGVHEQMCKKLKAHIGQKICQYSELDKSCIGQDARDFGINERYESTLISVDDAFHSQCIFLDTKEFGKYIYLHSTSPAIFICIEEDEVLETFDEIVRRKQEEIFQTLK